MKYMSVITNFGCHYKCPYCIVKENNLHIPKTTVAGLDNLRKSLKENGCNIISLSGGGDPLHEYDKHIEWYRKFFGIIQNHRVFFDDRERPIPVEMHTSYMTDETSFPFYDCYRVVYHANTLEQLSHIRRTGNELVDDNYEEKHHLEEYLRMGHKKLWWYIEQNDYNLYYAENQVSTRYRDFEKEVQV